MKKAIPMLIATIGLNLSIANPTRAITINFDNLSNQPARDGTIPFEQANGSKTLNGVTFENSPNGQPLNVTGDQYRVDSVTPGPTFGVPHSGNYFLNNRGNPAFLTTSLVLTEAWFGRVEYYGYGGGATSVTVVPLGVNGSLDPGVTVSLLSDRVLAQTKKIIEQEKLSVYDLPVLTDVDRPDDLYIWQSKKVCPNSKFNS
jgi:hypothetical protein